MPRRRTIREQLLRHIQGENWNDKTFCDKCGIDRVQLWRLKKGERGLNLDTLDKICKFLKIELRKIEDEPKTQGK
jgi:DNA-binding Xre family transcriptional regulator